MEKAIVLSGEIIREGHVVAVFNKKLNVDLPGPDYFYCIYVQKDKNEFPILLTPEQFVAAVELAEANKEDIPKKSLINDLTD